MLEYESVVTISRNPLWHPASFRPETDESQRHAPGGRDPLARRHVKGTRVAGFVELELASQPVERGARGPLSAWVTMARWILDLKR